MGLSLERIIYFPLALAMLAGSVSASPKLRLSRTAIGPLAVSMGAAAPEQSVEAFNAGDGELALDVRSGAPWIQVSLGEARECERAGRLCTPLLIQATTAGLAAGRHTGVVTVLAPGALDAAQIITVTLDAGGSLPQSLRFTVKPAGTDSSVIRTVNNVGARAVTETGGNWLSIPALSGGSFRFTNSYQVDAKHLIGMANGDYAGRVEISGSPVAEENRAVPVTMRVTDGPIAVAGATRIDVRLAAGAAAHSQLIEMTNRGSGTLTLASVAGSAAWLGGEALPDQRGALLILRPAELAPGFYRGEMEISSNAANSPNRVEVALEVLAQAEPWIRPLPFSDRITLGAVEEISPGMLLALRGEQLALGEAGQAEAPPWPAQLAGARLLVNGVPAALDRVTATEIRFQAPSELEPGEAVLEIERDGTKGNSIAVAVLPVTPRVESVAFDDGTPVSAEKPVRAGNRLLIAATGLGRCEPAVPAGTVAPEGARTVEAVTVSFLSSPFAPRVVAESQASPSTAQPGRYLVRVTVPEGISPSNFAALSVLAGGVSSNSVPIVVR